MDASRPTVLHGSDTASAVGSKLGQLPEAVTKDRIGRAQTKTKDFLARNSLMAHAQIRIMPKGGGHDTIETMAWAPRAWLDKQRSPDALRGPGAPWLLSSRPATVRSGAAQWPIVGAGHFLHMLKGEVSCLLWPASAVAERGADLMDVLFFLGGVG